MRLDIKGSAERKEKEGMDKDAVIQQLKTKTPTEINTWVEANLTNLADTRRIIKLILRLLLYLIKKT